MTVIRVARAWSFVSRVQIKREDASYGEDVDDNAVDRGVDGSVDADT